MTITQAVTAICTGLVSGISSIATGVASGVKGFVTGLMYEGTGDSAQLSSFMSVVVVFGAIALATTITTLVFNWIKNLGA